MYSSIMTECFRRVLLMVVATSTLIGCHTASQQAAAPTPEPQQTVGSAMKELYMEVSTSPPQSPQQQKFILRMAQQASNGKELLLVMRAAVGVFPASTSPEPASAAQVRSIVTGKMMKVATLDQMIEFAMQYPVAADQTRPYVERIFDLGKNSADARVWYRIRSAAYHLKVSDLEQEALAKAQHLSQ